MRRMAAIAVLLVAAMAAVPGSSSIGDEPAWIETGDGGADDDDMPVSKHGGRHFVVHLKVDLDSAVDGVTDLPVASVIDLADHLAEAGYPSRLTASGQRELRGFEVAMDSFTLHEVDANGASGSGRRLPVLVTGGTLDGKEVFHPATNPVITARWILDGPTQGVRYFDLYFDATHHDTREDTPPDGASLASSVGPGRGTRLYVPLDSRPGARGGLESRHVTVTSLFPGTTSVDIYEYQNGLPKAAPAVESQPLNGQGATFTYFHGRGGTDPSTGALLIDATLPVFVDSFSVAAGSQPNFAWSTFIPSADGGFLGKRFIAPAGGPWTVFCPEASLPEGETACRFTSGGGPTRSVPAGGAFVVQSSPTTLTATVGKVLVQRQGPGVTGWPATDGPASATSFLGRLHTPADVLMVQSRADDRGCILVKSDGARLTNKASAPLCIDPGPFVENPHWATTWGRSWETGTQADQGPASIEGYAGGRDLTVVSGAVDTTRQWGAMVPLQSADGGFTYEFDVPVNHAGIPLGHLVLYSPYHGTVVETVPERGLPPMHKHQRVDLTGGGHWSIEADRPVLVTWLKPGSEDFAGLAPGVTEVDGVSVVAADFADRIVDFDFGAGSTDVKKRPGDRVTFTFDVENLGRTIAGDGVADDVRLSLEAPAGWNYRILPSELELAPGGTTSAEVALVIPKDVNVEATTTLLLQATSTGGASVSQPLIINYVAKRDVDLTADGHDVRVRKTVDKDEAATYSIHVTNTGSVTDTYDITISDPNDLWEQSLLPVENALQARTAPLAPDERARYELRVQPVAGTDRATELITRIQAKGTIPTVTDSVRIETAIARNNTLRIDVDEPVRIVEPGSSTTFQVRLINEANTKEDLHVDVIADGPGSWAVPEVFWISAERIPLSSVSSIPVEAQSDTVLELVQAVPADAEALSRAVDRIRVRSLLFDTPSLDADMQVVAAETTGFDVEAELDSITAVPGTQVNLTLRFTSLGNVDQTLVVHPFVGATGTDWGIWDENRRTPPWNLTLARGGAEDLTVTLAVPYDALPSTLSKTSLTIQLLTEGMPAKTLRVPLEISEQPRATVDRGPVNLDPGRTTEIPVKVTNVGNVPLRTTVTLQDIPDEGWQAAPATTDLPIGANTTLHVLVQLASDVQRGQQVAAVLNITHGDGTPIAQVPVTLHTGHPVLEAVFVPEAERKVSPQETSYRISLRNTGDAPAYGVAVELASDDRIVDRFTLAQVLPGSEQIVSVIGPSKASVSARVTAAHDPEGIVTRSEPAEPHDRRIPSIGVGSVLAIAVAARMGRRPASWR